MLNGEIPDCEPCYTYISKTGRTLKKRLVDKYAINRGDPDNGIAVYANITLHEVDWKSATILDHEEHWMKHKVTEAIRIRERRPENTMNLDQGLALDSICSPIF